MIVYYDPHSFDPIHVVLAHDAEYDPACNGEHFIKTAVTMPMERMLLTKSADGTVTLSAKQDMPISLFASQIKLGVDALFSDVPDGAGIAINGKQVGTMDASGSFELTPTSTGFFTVAFSLAGYMDWSATLEVISGS